MRRVSIWTRPLAAAIAVSVAFAAQAAPGNGIRLGGSDARLHPFIDLEARWDSNVSYTPSNTAISDVILHIRPGLEIKAPGDAATFEFSGAVDRAQYLGIDDGNTTKLSKWYANAALAAAFNRTGAVSPRIDNGFTRQVTTTSLAAPAAGAVVSNQNTLSLSVPWKPGGGALVLAANGQWIVESFEKYDAPPPGMSLSDLGYNQYRGGAEAQWRFLPRTTGLLQAGYFARQPDATNRPGDATGWDALAGITGLLTPRITATAKAGYGATTAKEVTNAGGAVTLQGGTFSSFLADVGAEWLPADAFAVNAGYARTLGVDPYASVYTADGVSGGFKVKLAERVLFRAGARYDHLKFESQSMRGATTDYLRVDPAVEGSFGRWLNVALGYVYSSRVSGASGAVAAVNYAKSEAFLKVGLTY
jgi:hypothetical protein